jgi:hypothetical protein
MKAVRSIAAILFATLVLVSSTSFMVGIHFCMGHVQDVALFTKATPCAMEQTMPPCHVIQKTPCCADETLVHDGQDFKVGVALAQLLASTPIELQQPFLLLSEIIPVTQVSRIQNDNYDPPLRSCDLTINHQVFLI